MAVYSEFVYGAEVYGDTSLSTNDIYDVKFIRNNLLQITFLKDLVVNKDYYDVGTLAITPFDDAPIVSIRNILKLSSLTQASQSLLVVTDPIPEGAQYSVSIPPYQYRDGSTSSPCFIYAKYTRTKVDNILRSIPSHFDKSLSSNISSLLTAIAYSDELIGGARNDIVFQLTTEQLSGGSVTVDNMFMTVNGEDVTV